jgi:DNA-binding NarL/FixJ family response regulator
MCVMGETFKKGKKPIKLVIADDSDEIRRLMDLLLSEIDGIAVCGKAKNGIEALQMVTELSPDVVLLDVSMPGKSGIEVLQEIRKDDQSTKIIMFTIDPQLRDYCLNAGANYFFSKNEIGDLVDTLQRLLEQRRT